MEQQPENQLDHQTEDLLLLLKTLADESRLALLRQLHQQERGVGELAEAIHLTEPTVSHHLSKLRMAGLVTLRTSGTQRFYRLNPAGLARFKKLMETIEQIPVSAVQEKTDESWIERLGWPEEELKVLREHTRGGRITTLPNKYKKTGVLLRWVSTLFEPQRFYTEAEVNEVLKSVYKEDFVSLRRDLIDLGYVRRERGGGKYWVTPADEKPAS
ncbi:MAG: metalloregulator ArsR/SmtB family transcription factor [Anaerolineaceae bacterium]